MKSLKIKKNYKTANGTKRLIRIQKFPLYCPCNFKFDFDLFWAGWRPSVCIVHKKRKKTNKKKTNSGRYSVSETF